MKTINKLAIAAALGLTVASAVQAETVVVPVTRQTAVEQRAVVDRPIMRRSTAMTTRTAHPPLPTTTVVSGSTLAGRREIISNDAVVVPSGTRGRVVYSTDSGAIKSQRVRGYLAPGTAGAEQPSIAFGGTRMSD